MPTYDYVCSKCGHAFEKVQSIKDDALTICPKELCAKKTWGKGKVKRSVGGGSGIIFKGSGFYITDYRSENYKAGAKKDSSASVSNKAPTTPAPATPSAPKSDGKGTPPAKS